VIGDGAVGLSAVLAAKRLRAERIILMGRHQARTDLGREFGAPTSCRSAAMRASPRSGSSPAVTVPTPCSGASAPGRRSRWRSASRATAAWRAGSGPPGTRRCRWTSEP
jgi:threonine dehydrogenase-like Zn-dependent dehydrogenase